ASRRIRIVTVDSRAPSPFAASLLFSYVSNFIYDGDSPLAERRAQALSVDQAQLKELLGEAELRELLDARAIEELERSLPRPDAFLEDVEDPLGDLVARWARTHGPFRAEDVAARFGLPIAPVRAVLERLAEKERVVEGEFLPGGRTREWCDAGVLKALKRRSLAKLRKEIEPVDAPAFARFLVEWQGVSRPRAGLDALLSSIEQLSGAPVPASVLETEIL